MSQKLKDIFIELSHVSFEKFRVSERINRFLNPVKNPDQLVNPVTLTLNERIWKSRDLGWLKQIVATKKICRQNETEFFYSCSICQSLEMDCVYFYRARTEPKLL